MRVDAVIVLSNMAVDFLVDALTAFMCGVLTNTDGGVFANVNVNVLAAVMTTFDFAMSGPLEGFRC